MNSLRKHCVGMIWRLAACCLLMHGTALAGETALNDATSSPSLSETSGLKTPWMGLVARSGFPAEGLESVTRNAMCEVNWNDLEPSEGHYDFSKIDQFLDEAAKRNLNVGIRLFCGRKAPEWLKKKAGVYRANNTYSKVIADVIRFWTPEAAEAYDHLQEALAAKYDTNPRVLVITMSRCSTIFAEPFQRQMNDPETLRQMRAGGYTSAIDKQAQIDTVKTHAKYWKHTRSSIAINPYQSISDQGKVEPDLKFDGEFIEQAADILGSRFLLQNNSIRDNPKMMEQGEYAEMYQLMTALNQTRHVPIGFQTAAPDSRLGDMRKTLQKAVLMHGCYVEVYNDFRKNMTIAEAKEFDRQLRANFPKGK